MSDSGADRGVRVELVLTRRQAAALLRATLTVGYGVHRSVDLEEAERRLMEAVRIAHGGDNPQPRAVGPRGVKVSGGLFHPVVPPGAIYVGRQCPGLRRSPWANPFRPGKPTPALVPFGGRMWNTPDQFYGVWPPTPADAVNWYESLLGLTNLGGEIIAKLAGRDLACWCDIGDHCHREPLLWIANGIDPATGNPA